MSEKFQDIVKAAPPSLESDGGPERPLSFNEWFLSLPAGRQEVLREDKWMLAEAAFSAGIEQGSQR